MENDKNLLKALIYIDRETLEIVSCGPCPDSEGDECLIKKAVAKYNNGINKIWGFFK